MGDYQALRGSGRAPAREFLGEKDVFILARLCVKRRIASALGRTSIQTRPLGVHKVQPAHRKFVGCSRASSGLCKECYPFLFSHALVTGTAFSQAVLGSPNQQRKGCRDDCPYYRLKCLLFCGVFSTGSPTVTMCGVRFSPISLNRNLAPFD